MKNSAMTEFNRVNSLRNHCCMKISEEDCEGCEVLESCAAVQEAVADHLEALIDIYKLEVTLT